MDACRVLPHESCDGPANMGLDEALLDSVAEGCSGAVLRTYSWSRPTLSLGYFQPMARAEAEPRWQAVPLVRRPTGGGALWHDRELTYALVVPASHPLGRRSPDLYRAVHAAIASLLREMGLRARRRGESGPPPDRASKPFLCFCDRDPEDVVADRITSWTGERPAEPGPSRASGGMAESAWPLVDGGGIVHKLVGSAQRRRAGAVLQHGSILLEHSPATPELPGAADLAGLAFDPAAWARALGVAIPRVLGLEAVRGAVSAGERERAGRLADQVYRDPAWTRKR
jgi:lipoate-protein ligase A